MRIYIGMYVTKDWSTEIVDIGLEYNIVASNTKLRSIEKNDKSNDVVVWTIKAIDLVPNVAICDEQVYPLLPL